MVLENQLESSLLTLQKSFSERNLKAFETGEKFALSYKLTNVSRKLQFLGFMDFFWFSRIYEVWASKKLNKYIFSKSTSWNES